jgi:glyoxylase-like metal-dependent hydrolase (beta-lactamase superfamily II)/rhodanese-related sulfurtransferase
MKAVMDIDVAALDRLLTAPEQSDDVLLDTRDRGVAARWHPEGPGARYLNVPYDDFEGDQDAAVAQLPENARNVHVLCARGISALDIAEILRERGIHAGIVGGGMAAWARYHRIVRVSAPDEAFAIYQIVRPAKGCLSYLVVSGKQALAIDCTRFTDVYRELCERLGVTLVGVADSHLHADHISGSSKLASGAAPYYLSDEDAAGGTLRCDSVPRVIEIGETPIRVLSLPVPGHTLGSTAFYIGDRYLVSGDTLLPNGVGRPDLGNRALEWTEYLYESLTGVLAKRDPSTVALPAHAGTASDYNSDGACIRKLGDLLAAQLSTDRAVFVDQVSSAVAKTSQPAEYAEIRRVNLGTDASEQRVAELETGVNQCALKR